MNISSDYAELHCISNFTFLRGASHPEELVSQASLLGYKAIAITDECSLSGIVRAHVEAKEKDIKLIVGSEFRIKDGPACVLLARDRQSYGQLSHLITESRRRAAKGSYYLDRSLFHTCLPHGCLALYLPGPGSNKDRTEELSWLSALFPENCWIAVELMLDGNDKAYLQELTSLGKQLGLNLCACGDVHMHLRKRRYLQNTLTAIRLGKPIDQLGYEVYSNGERYLRELHRLIKLYPPELLAESTFIATRCQFSGCS